LEVVWPIENGKQQGLSQDRDGAFGAGECSLALSPSQARPERARLFRVFGQR